MRIKNQTGFGIVGLLAVVVIAGVIFMSGRYLYNRGGQSLDKNRSKQVTGQGADAQSQGDINAIASRLESYYQAHNHYPSSANLSDEDWVKTNLGGLDKAALVDPNGNSLGMSESLYAYDPSPLGCSDCQSFVLSAELSDSSVYEKSSLK